MLLQTPFSGDSEWEIVVGCGVAREELEGTSDIITTKLDIEVANRGRHS